MSQAREIAEQLEAIRGCAKPHPNGAHGQIIGQETWRITLSGNDLQVITDAADKLIELEQQREPCRRCAAFEGLTKAQEAQLSHHREQADKYREAIATLDSEREANRLLTEQRDKLLAALELIMERMELPPDTDCYCHISPPCHDCVENSGIREAIELAESTLAEVKGDK